MIIMLEFMEAKSRYQDIYPKYFKFINGTLLINLLSSKK